MPDTTTRLSVAELAAAAFRKYEDDAMAQGDEMFDQHREEFLTYARTMGRSVLGEEVSAHLDWQYTGTMHLPADTEEATARIDNGTAYLRYRATEDEATFELVQPCGACGHQEINEVTNLIKLGALLETATWKAASQAVIA